MSNRVEQPTFLYTKQTYTRNIMIYLECLVCSGAGNRWLAYKKAYMHTLSQQLKMKRSHTRAFESIKRPNRFVLNFFIS